MACMGSGLPTDELHEILPFLHHLDTVEAMYLPKVCYFEAVFATQTPPFTAAHPEVAGIWEVPLRIFFLQKPPAFGVLSINLT